MGSAARQFDDAVVNFYEDQLVAQADSVYRFAFALTLSLDGAHRCVERTYREVATDLEKIYGAGDPSILATLLSYCWRAYDGMKGQSFAEGQSAVTKALKALSPPVRAAMAAVDIAGLAPAEAARVLASTETQVRAHLAQARKALMMSTLDV